jgi:hypothetical protein
MKAKMAVLAFGLFAAHVCAAQSTIDLTNKWAWAASASWINCRVDATNGAVIGQFACSGYLYNPNTGWIHLGSGSPTSGVWYGNAATNDYGVNHDGTGNLRGYAWSESVGWIVFEDSGAPTVDLQTGVLGGLGWGEAVGWVNFSNLQVYVQTTNLAPGPDDDGDGIPDPWEIERTGSTNVLSAGGDADGDGATDEDEYTADTHPTNTQDAFRVTAIDRTDATTASLTWASRPTRLYRIERRGGLGSGTSWVENPLLGPQPPDPGSNTTRTVTNALPSAEFYRVKAALPLSP